MQSTFREDVEETDPFGETYTQRCPFTSFKVSVLGVRFCQHARRHACTHTDIIITQLLIW